MFSRKQKIKLLPVAALSLVAGLSIWAQSCTKNTLQTPFNRLIGSWRLTQTGTDDNENGKLDTHETVTPPTGYSDIIKFNKDYTGVEEISYDSTVSDFPFTWALPAGDSIVRYYSGHDTVVSYIQQINGSNLTLENMKTTYSPVLTWNIYKKI